MSLSLSERDRAVIWHPYTQHLNNQPPIPISRGQGCLLYDEKGNAYVDAISSWWVNIHGHAHPYIAEKIYEQAKKLEHVIFTGFTHEPAVQLAERLLPLLPGHFSKIFYSDNGSTAVEVAIKMAIQYWRNQDQLGKRTKILALRHSYHGDTFGAMSVSDRGIFTLAFDRFLFEVVFIDPPDDENLETLKNSLDDLADDLACFIYEPLLQGAGGMKLINPGALDQLLQFLQERKIICIADEVLTGFGRTGKAFAGEYLQQKADLICLSKGLTGGTMALGVTASTQKIFDAFLSEDRGKTFFHGHSFTANPIACAAALASLDLFEKKECRQKIDEIVAQNRELKIRLDDFSTGVLKNPRFLGTMLAFELDTGQDGYLNSISATVTQKALKNGIYLRPLGNTVYILPPYCISDEQMNSLHVFLTELGTTAN